MSPNFIVKPFYSLSLWIKDVLLSDHSLLFPSFLFSPFLPSSLARSLSLFGGGRDDSIPGCPGAHRCPVPHQAFILFDVRYLFIVCWEFLLSTFHLLSDYWTRRAVLWNSWYFTQDASEKKEASRWASHSYNCLKEVSDQGFHTRFVSSDSGLYEIILLLS